METEEIKKLINEYFDGELNKEKEIFLFTLLSQNEEGREYFKKLNILRNVLNENSQEVPFELEERIFRSIGKFENKNEKVFTAKNIFVFGSYALAIILIIVSIFLFNEVNNYKDEVDEALEIVKAKSETVDLLLNNTLPVAEVKGKFIPNKSYLNEIIVKGKL